MSATPLLLEGVKVLTLEQVHALPWGTAFLADLGARVIRIDLPATVAFKSLSVTCKIARPGLFRTANLVRSGGTKAATSLTSARAINKVSVWR